MAHQLELKLLGEGNITSAKLVEAYLDHIDRHNHKGLHLNALVSVAPRALVLQAARTLEDERRGGKLRGPLHSIPIVVKDMFLTSTTTLGLPTTLGSPCFASATSTHNSPLVQRLVDNGLIILGKANMTEFCGLKMRPNTPGWSPQGSQTQNPYIFGGLDKDEKLIGNSSPGGSSSGSGAAVAAGFAPFALGSETGGSVVLPSNRSALYAMKCGHGTVNIDGNYRLSRDIDGVGVMAKTAMDVSLLASLIMGRAEAFDVQNELGFKGLAIGFLDPDVWHITDSVCSFPGDTNQQIKDVYRHAIDVMQKSGADVTVNIDLATADLTTKDGKSLMYEICMQQLRSRHLTEFMAHFKTSDVRSLEEMVAWNEAHADISMPPGYPIACVPLSTVKYSDDNARPFGLSLTAPQGKEDVLLHFMHAFELAFPPRPLPQPVLHALKPFRRCGDGLMTSNMRYRSNGCPCA